MLPCSRIRQEAAMRTRSFNLTLIALAIATGFLGITQTLWSENVTIGGTITTSDVAGIWFYRSCDEKPKGQETATWLIEPDPNDSSRHRLLVTIQNGYPNFSLYCEVHFANDGTVPIEITNVKVFNPNPAKLTITAVEAEPNKIMQPCGFTPDWYEGRKGTETRDVPADTVDRKSSFGSPSKAQSSARQLLDLSSRFNRSTR